MTWLWWHYPGQSAQAVCLQLLLGVFEGVGLLLILPMLALAGLSAHQQGLSAVVQKLLQFFPVSMSITQLLLVYMILLSGFACLNYYSSVVSAKLQRQATQALQRNLHEMMLLADWAFLSKLTAEQVQQLITQAPAFLSVIIMQMIRLLSCLLLLVVYVVLTMMTSPIILAVALVSASMLFVAYRFTNKKMRHQGKAYFDASMTLYHELGEHSANLKLAKLGAQNVYLLNSLKKTFSSMANAQYGANIWSARTRLLYMLGAAVMLCVFLWIALGWLSLPVTSFILLAIIFVRMQAKVQGVQSAWQHCQHALPSVSMSFALIQQAKQYYSHDHGGDKRIPLHNALRLVDVDYTVDGQPILNQFNAMIPACSLTLISGASGAGKTTLVDIIACVLQPDAGALLIDGMLLEAGNASIWRKQVAYLDAQNYFKPGSVRDNLLVYCSDVTDEECIDVLKQAHAWILFADRGGLDYQLYGNANNLSKGERQRLALARTLLSRPSLLILDEALNAIDRSCEQEILKALAVLKQSLTVILISHRYQWLPMADQVITMPVKTVNVDIETL